MSDLLLANMVLWNGPNELERASETSGATSGLARFSMACSHASCGQWHGVYLVPAQVQGLDLSQPS